jgi:hypothetical protein
MKILEILDRFEPISLSELGGASLLDRVDRKFILPLSAVPDVLAELVGEYRVLEVGDSRSSRYHTVYFDSPEFRLYHDHHAGRFPRFKVRLRSYESSGEVWVEVKRKSRGGRTQKVRFPHSLGGAEPMEVLEEADPLALGGSVSPRELHPVINVEYRRATLVGREGRERVTVDTLLECERGGEKRSFPEMTILEVKQANSFNSPIIRLLRERGIRTVSISKYCLCVASVERGVKTNRFKPTLRRVAVANGAPLLRI